MAKIKKIKLDTTTYDICDADAVHTVKQDGITGATVNRFGTCSTGGSTAAKTVSITTGTFTLETGARVTVKFTNKNTAKNPTLNVNSTGAKNIFHDGAQVKEGVNIDMLCGTVDFVYDGTQWQLVGNYVDTHWTLSALKATLLDTIYPVGSIYISVSETSPASFLGGTWDKIEDAYLYAKLSTETAGSIYGDTDYKISTEQLPAHTHTMAHTHTGPSHTHTMNSHTHGNTFAVAPTSYDEYTDTAVNAGSPEARKGSFKVRGAENEYGKPAIVWGATGCVSVSPQSGSGESIEIVDDRSGYSEATVSFNTTNHKHSFIHTHDLNGDVEDATSTMQAAGTGLTSGASNSTTGSVGSGSAYKPKYLAVIVWKRTA